jgi:predicted transcriptional regulator
MTEDPKKTDVLNLRMDPALAGEIQRIAEWREVSASEVARELIRHGIAVERQLEAQELRQAYEHSKIERNLDRGHLKIDAEWVWYTPREIVEMLDEREHWEGLA